MISSLDSAGNLARFIFAVIPELPTLDVSGNDIALTREVCGNAGVYIPTSPVSCFEDGIDSENPGRCEEGGDADSEGGVGEEGNRAAKAAFTIALGPEAATNSTSFKPAPPIPSCSYSINDTGAGGNIDAPIVELLRLNPDEGKLGNGIGPLGTRCGISSSESDEEEDEEREWAEKEHDKVKSSCACACERVRDTGGMKGEYAGVLSTSTLSGIYSASKPESNPWLSSGVSSCSISRLKSTSGSRCPVRR